MIWTAWNNGAYHATGAGYGLKISANDRDGYFNRDWSSVFLEPPFNGANQTIEFNVAKPSFWNNTCRELINADFGRWLLNNNYAPWPKRQPPKLNVSFIGGQTFRLIDFV